MSKSRDILAALAAKMAATGESRGVNYGDPEENFENIANFWQAWVQARHGYAIGFDSHDVGVMSALIKIARLAKSPTHADSALDAAMYTILGHGCAVAADGQSSAFSGEVPEELWTPPADMQEAQTDAFVKFSVHGEESVRRFHGEKVTVWTSPSYIQQAQTDDYVAKPAKTFDDEVDLTSPPDARMGLTLDDMGYK